MQAVITMFSSARSNKVSSPCSVQFIVPGCHHHVQFSSLSKIRAIITMFSSVHLLGRGCPHHVQFCSLSRTRLPHTCSVHLVNMFSSVHLVGPEYQHVHVDHNFLVQQLDNQVLEDGSQVTVHDIISFNYLLH